MYCNNCQKEFPEEERCPECGAAAEEMTVEEEIAEEAVAEVAAEETVAEEISGELNEETAEETESEEEVPAKKKMKLWQVLVVILGGVVLLGVLACAVLYGLGVDLKPRENNVLYKDSYTVADAEVPKYTDDVVATLGDKELTNGELQMYYQNSIYAFYSQYAYYISYFGLDLSSPLDAQPCTVSETPMSWQQYFIDGAIGSWQSYAILETLVEKDNFQIDPALQTELDAMAANLQTYAEAYGYGSVEEYLADELGAGVSLEDYLHFNRSYYVGNAYLENFYVTNVPTQEEIDAYFIKNEAVFAENGVTKDMGLISSVRHILVPFEGGTTDESGVTTYSEDEKAAAMAEAERILAEWKAGEATEDSFAELANTYSADGGSNTTGGLYENVCADGSYVPNFEGWSVDATRQYGDTGIIESPYGYHVMYFVSGEDYCSYKVSEQIVADYIQEVLNEAKEAYPMKVNYKKIALAEVLF